MHKFRGAAGFSAALGGIMAAASTAEPGKKSREELNVDELSLYTVPEQKCQCAEPVRGVMEENITTLRNMAEPYLTWCQQTSTSTREKVEGVCDVVKPKLEQTVQFGQDSLVYLSAPPPEFYPRVGVIGFAGLVGLFLSRGSRMKRLVYPTTLMVIGASMYYPQQAATIAKGTGDAVYELALQAYVAAENLTKGKPALRSSSEKKVEQKAAGGETKS